MSAHDRLLSLLADRSARRGQFTLASGRQSTLYIDARLTTMSPEGLALIGRAGLAVARGDGELSARLLDEARDAVVRRLQGLAS